MKFLQECHVIAVPWLLSCFYLASNDLPINDLSVDFIVSTVIYADDTNLYHLPPTVYYTLTLMRLLILVTTSWLLNLNLT